MNPSYIGGLTGQLSIATGCAHEAYSGAYTVVPRAHDAQTLPTENKLLTKNVTVEKVPFFETDNDANGKTVYIAEEAM